MSKLQRISELQHPFLFFSPSENFNLFYNRFLESDLGNIYLSIPWNGLVKDFPLKEPRKRTKNIFSLKGKVACMFLILYAGCSDRKLIEQLHGNVNDQIFWDLYLGLHRIENYKIVSQIRCALAG